MSEDRLKNRSFSAQKLALLASLLDEEGLRQAPSLQRISRDGELPLSSSQMRLWLFDQLEPGSSAYSIPVRHDFKGPFDIAAFERSLSEIVRRHEVLRTCYLRIDGRPVQKIVPPESFRLPVIDLQESLPDAAREQEVASLASAFAKQPIELGNAPLLRASLLKLSPDEHVLLLNIHHIACDWWSFGVFEKELAAVYDAFVRGEASPLPELPLQYVDFTAWQQERLQGEMLREQLDYWQEKLSGELPTLELPTDHPRPAVQTYNGSFVSSAISKELTEALKTLSQREGTTLFATLLGAFKVLLQRYTGEDDILVGVPIAGRNRPEIEGLIGFFVNTLVLRTDLSGDPTFREFLRRVHETSLGAYADQDVPFERLVEVLNPKRDSSRSPMFQVMLSMLNTPMEPMQLAGLQHQRTMLDSGTAKFDLTLYAIEEPTGISFTCEYNTDLFHSDRIRRMLGHLEVLLAGVVENPDRRLSELPILTQEERQEVLIGWNETRLAYPQEVLLHQLFEAQAERTPAAIAVEYDGKELTYSELNRRANQLAHYLLRQGVGPETLVGISMERSLEMVVGLLGILKAGAAYVPLDPAYPKERLAFMVEDAQVGVLLTRDGETGWVNQGRIKTVRMDSDAEEIARQSDANPINTAASNDLAYVIYTSGSTGKSKGVQIEHRSVVNFLTSMRRQPGLVEKDVLLSVTTLSFDIAALEVFLPLTVGARLMLVSREVASDGLRLAEQLEKAGATVMQATPATWRLLIEAGWQGSKRIRILCGGEALDRELANQLLKRCAGLWNLYGPTETTIWSAIQKVESESASELKAGPVSIGRPIANTQLYVLDRHLQPVPVGVTGELLIGGDGLARGYLNRPELTAEKFIRNPFSISGDADGRGSDRLYRTGDLARYLPDGSIDFLGRNDYQVKIRGFRIELGEIEAMLGGHPSVQKAVVVAREDEPGEKRLVAYIVPTSGAKSEQASPVDALRNFLREKLPAHMVPPFFVFMEKMPLTPNGKIDRKALPAPHPAGSGGVDRGVIGVASGFEAPRDPLEQSLAQIWSKILKVKKIGIRDNFFELGGHSLLAVRITAEIEKLVKKSLPLATFLQAPTIADLAEVLRKKDWNPSWSSLQRISRDGELPLSSSQMQLWLFDQLEPGSSAYNIPVRYDFKGHFNLAAFERSLSEIVGRHEVLRTSYLSVDGSPVQKICPPELFRVTTVDLQGLSVAAREQEVASLASSFARQPFELRAAPLLRANLLKLSPDEHVLLLNIHHIACDWWSFGVFEKELAAVYDAFVRGEASPLPDLPLQYVDFTAWQQERLQGEMLREQLDYWQEKLSGELPTLELPTDHPRPAVQTYNGSFVSSAISKELTEALKTLSQREGTTLFATLLGAFKVLLQRYTGEDDILVGVPIAGRNRPEIEGLIGFFVNTLVLRTDLSGDPTFREFLRRVHETSLGAYADQDVPFEKLVEVLNPKRDSSRSPMFQVMLSMLNTPMEPMQLAGLQHQRTMLDSGTAKFDLTLYAIEEPTGISFTCEYNTDLFHSDRIRRMLGHLEVLLAGVVENPDRRLSELPILTQEERQEVLIGWNETRLAYPQEVLLHQLFEAQAERTPAAIAVEYDGKELTYSELNRRANQLAHYLLRQGVGPETLVGISMERSLEMVVGLLGILKAGAAYVPLDPAYPKERLAFMVEDAQVGVLLTRDGETGWVNQGRIKTVRMDSDAEEIARQSDANPINTAASNDLAYVIYTSGSTGKSKGVQIEHRSVVNFLTSMRRQPGLVEKDVLLSVTTLSFDIAALEVFLPLTVGARLMLVSREVASDGLRLAEQLEKAGATVMQATPATWRLLIEAGWQGSKRIRILCGGEALDRELANQLLKRCAGLWNLYGPTETTIWSAIQKVESESASELKAGPVSIGRPIANTQLYVLDRHLQPVPVGVTGELLIGGDGLARGYLNRPELTAEKFIRNPFSISGDADGRGSDRLYRTGDLARYLPDGSIDFLGRNDYQVKIRGFRIELGEIEAMLGGHPSVQKAVVVAREDEPGEKRLVAYIVPTSGAKSEQASPVDALRNFLREKLPAHMVPPFFVFMEKMPLTPNGKIDRKALPAPHPAGSGGVDRGVIGVASGFEAPRDPLEQSLAQIWSKILKVKKIGIRDNFFELGGHSLLAVRITAEIEKLVKKSLPLATFLQAPTIADLAEVLRKKDWNPSWSSLIPLRAGGSKPPFFLMHSHGGNVLEYYPLAETLEADQPVYALQARGLNGLIVKDQSIEAMVEAHLRELRSLQPEGPYFLGGYCLGGLLALEAARQLTAAGEEVGLVVLIQTINPTYARFRPELARWQRAWYRASKRVDLEFAYLRHRGGNHILERGRRTRDIAVARSAIAFDNWRGDGHGRRRATSMAHTLELLAIEHERARARYELRPYNGPVLLFRASKQIGGLLADSNLGWKDVLTGELTVCEVPGHQETMLLEPNVSYLAKELSAQLRAVQRSAVATSRSSG